MTAGVAELVGTIERMTGQHQALLQLVQEQQEALIQGDTDGVQCVLGKLDDVVQGILTSERLRMEQTAHLADALGLDVSEASAINLADSVGKDEGQRLTVAADSLRRVIEELVLQNRRNQQLTEFAAEYSNTLLGMLLKMGKNNHYGPAGTPAGPSRIFDVKA